MMPALEHLRLQLGDWGVELESSQLALLGIYADLLAGYKRANVIGTSDSGRIVAEHLSDSLSCLLVKDLQGSGSVIDVGSGGGLPGVAIAISRPTLGVTLLEAKEKKVRFLDYVRESLGLPNLAVIRGRAEEEGHRSANREAFDVAVARALADLPVVVEYCAPLVRVGGQIVAMKGRLTEEELCRGVAASRVLGLELRGVRKVRYRAHLPQKERQLVIFEKLYGTPAGFPRKVGLAKKRPLGSGVKAHS